MKPGRAAVVKDAAEAGPVSAAVGEVWLADLWAVPELQLIVSSRRYVSGRTDMALTAASTPRLSAPAAANDIPGEDHDFLRACCGKLGEQLHDLEFAARANARGRAHKEPPH